MVEDKEDGCIINWPAKLSSHTPGHFLRETEYTPAFPEDCDSVLEEDFSQPIDMRFII